MSGRQNGGVQALTKEDFVVNVDRQESNLEALSAKEAVASLRGQKSDGQGNSGEASSFTWDTGSQGDPNQISQWLLLAMLCFFVAESLLTAQRRKRKDPGLPDLGQKGRGEA